MLSFFKNTYVDISMQNISYIHMNCVNHWMEFVVYVAYIWGTSFMCVAASEWSATRVLSKSLIAMHHIFQKHLKASNA